MISYNGGRGISGGKVSTFSSLFFAGGKEHLQRLNRVICYQALVPTGLLFAFNNS